jgi:hypothetical protein
MTPTSTFDLTEQLDLLKLRPMIGAGGIFSELQTNAAKLLEKEVRPRQDGLF